jgi:acyl carrier protein phosphodiesterase
MNFLAHSYYIPEDNTLLRLSCLSADAFKGKKWENYKEEVGKGIQIHRKMDEWIDQHDKSKALASKFQKVLKRYKGIAVDMLLDHYLANSIITKEKLENYHTRIATEFELNKAFLPAGQQQLCTLIFDRKWLLEYSTLKGLENILSQMSRRIQKRVDFTQITPIYLEHKVEIDAVLKSLHQDALIKFNLGFEKLLPKNALK